MALHLQLIFVALGGGLGAATRHLLVVTSHSIAQSIFGGGAMASAAFPYGVLIANVFGCGLIGLLIGFLTFYESSNRLDLSLPVFTSHLRLFLGTGFLGGFTTFSAFSLDALMLWRSGQVGLATLYVGTTVIMCLAAVAIGDWVAKNI